MKPMNYDDLNLILNSGKSSGTSLAMYAARIVRKFVDGGYEAVEVEPNDFGRTHHMVRTHTPAHMRAELCKKIEEFGLSNVMQARTSKGRIYLMRTCA